MSYRSDLQAAHNRIQALEKQLALERRFRGSDEEKKLKTEVATWRVRTEYSKESADHYKETVEHYKKTANHWMEMYFKQCEMYHEAVNMYYELKKEYARKQAAHRLKPEIRVHESVFNSLLGLEGVKNDEQH